MSYIRNVLFVTLILLISGIIILSLVPPVSKDALVHHLAVPKLYLIHGGMYEIPFMPFSYYPMNLHLLYMIPLYFGNDILPKFIHFVFGLLTAWLIFLYLKSRTHKLYGLLGALVFLSTPIILKLSTTIYIDLGEVFFSFASIYFILEWARKEFRAKYLFWAGVMCGLGLGTKYNGLITCFLLTLFIPIIHLRSTRRQGFLKPVGYAVLFFLVSMLVFSPWMVRNYSWKGNPIYPLYNKYFNPPAQATGDGPGGAPSVEQNWGFFTYRSMVYNESGLEIALLPLRIFFQGQDGDPQYFDGRLNPFLLLLPFFAFLPTRQRMDYQTRVEKKVLLWFAILFFFFSFFSAVLRIRYIAPIIPPLVILSVFGTGNLFAWAGESKPIIVRKSGSLIIALGIIFMMFLNASYLFKLFDYVNPIPYLKGEVSRGEYIARYRPEYPAMEYINKHLDPETRVFFIFIGDRGYYCDREYLYDMGLMKRVLSRSTKPEEIRSGFTDRGITHLLIFFPLMDRWVNDNFDEEKKMLLREFFKGYTSFIFEENGFGVLGLKG